MNMRWSLNELYTSFDSEEYQGDLQKFDEGLGSFIQWADKNLKSPDNPQEKITEYLNRLIELSTLVSKLMAYPCLISSVEANNELALKYLDKLQVQYSKFTQPSVQFQKFISTLDNLDEIINSSPFLREHEFYLNETKKKAQYLLSEKEEVLISKMKNTGSNAWSNLQGVLSSTLLVDIEIDGKPKQLPLPVVRNMAFDKDPNIRQKAYEAELKSYDKIAKSSAAALNGIKGEVLTISEMRGFKSPLEETLFKSRMDEETLDAIIRAIEEYLPIFHKYYRKKGELLGHRNGLPFYDIFAPIGNAIKSYTYEEARKFIVVNFRTFSDRLADFADNAFENRWIDAEPRDGKRGGAFCFNLYPIKESRILANFNGSLSNVITLAHELGHGYHGLCIQEESILNSSYPMPLAETASIFCETIVMNAVLNEASPEEQLSILESSLQDAGQVIVDIYSRFLFEKELFERRKEHSLSVNELKEIMIESQKKAYGNGLDENYLHPYMWINKPHYYYGERNFYNFPYAFGLLFSKGLYVEYLNDKKNFVKRYDDFLRATGKNNIVDVAKLMGIDVHSPDFFKDSLKLIEKDIDKFIDLIENRK
ncbi:M3 family oligoendopeptidase [Tepidimicrobium xylanilyticum]|uniref:Oligoendopeptidase, pepF/M3 family n=1 Tax=Tepidimicrobium xylanilyticum TaxID=1123352 RepID=A0A1H2X804_9FIRM|nr:M3 family oligoendopeptidase [Tepidimicrobium xylanilyticum]SDW88389.1 oligoendopeptidase, pepF/M3 family [Tepidimicrobium xylanilyticum]